MWKTKFSSHKRYLFGLLFSRNAKKTQTDQSIQQLYQYTLYTQYKRSILCLEGNVSKTFKVAAAEKSFPSMYIIDTTCFNECFYPV